MRRYGADKKIESIRPSAMESKAKKKDFRRKTLGVTTFEGYI